MLVQTRHSRRLAQPYLYALFLLLPYLAVGCRTDAPINPAPVAAEVTSEIIEVEPSPGFQLSGLPRPINEEDDPGIIRFYGSVYIPDSFFWVLDTSTGSTSTRSASTDPGTGATARLDVLKHELGGAIHALSPRAKFGIVSFSTEARSFQPHPVFARPEQKEDAVAWVNAQEPGKGACFTDGVIAALELARDSGRRHTRVICLVDGDSYGPNIETEIVQINEANWSRITIDVLMCGGDAVAAEQMRKLAHENGGSFAQICD